MKKINLLNRAEMKKVLGGNADPGGEGVEGSGEGNFCSFKYKYTSASEPWTSWSATVYAKDGGRAQCVQWIGAGTMVRCGYDCIDPD